MIAVLQQVDNSQHPDITLPESIVRKISVRAIPEDRARTVAGYGLMLDILAKAYDINAPQLCFNDNGKPYLQGGGMPFISLSHSGGYVLCAADKKAVGVDIEKRRDVDLRVAERFCSGFELNEIQCSDKPQDMLFRLWTLKEAYYKRMGHVNDIRSVSFNLAGDCLAACSDKNVAAFSFRHREYFIAICRTK